MSMCVCVCMCVYIHACILVCGRVSAWMYIVYSCILYSAPSFYFYVRLQSFFLFQILLFHCHHGRHLLKPVVCFGNLFVLFVLLKFLFFNIQGLFFMFNFFQLIEWKLEQIGMNPTAETYLCLHRFGSVSILSNRYFCVCINNRLGQYVWLPS